MRRRRSTAGRTRFLTLASLRWIIRRRAFSPYHLRRYWRFSWFRLRNPHVTCEGLVFLGKDVRVHARPGHGRVVLGRFTHLGDGCRLYAHEGTLRVGAKSVLGRQVTITTYLDVFVGESCLLADWTYVTDFDHDVTDVHLPIKDQGLAKSPVRVGHDCWLGVRSTVLRGSRIGDGTAIGAHSVVRGTLPRLTVAAGVPARVLKDRRELYEADRARREYLEGIARGNARRMAEATRAPARPDANDADTRTR